MYYGCKIDRMDPDRPILSSSVGSSSKKRFTADVYLVAICSKGSAFSGRSALRSAVRGDLVVPSRRTDWGLKAFAVAGPSCWNELPVELRGLTVGPATFAKHWKTQLFRVFFSDGARTFEFV